MTSKRLSSEERFLIARNFAGSKRVRAIARLLSRAASTVSRELGRNGSIVGRRRHELRSMANCCDEDSDSAHQKSSSQFAVRRRPGIGPQPTSEEAEDLVVEFLSRGHSPEQIAAVPGQYPRPAGHAWIYSRAGSRPAPWRAVVQASALLAARGGEAAQERTCAVLSLIGSASLSAPKVPICAAVLAIGKVTLWSVG